MAEIEPTRDTDGDLLRDQARKRFYDVGSWGLANVIKQHVGLSRCAAVNRVSGKPPENVSDLLAGIPFGSTVTINQQSRPRAGVSVWLAWLLLGLLAAAGWFVVASLNQPAETTVDGVLEWEFRDGTVHVTNINGRSTAAGSREGTTGGGTGRLSEAP